MGWTTTPWPFIMVVLLGGNPMALADAIVDVIAAIEVDTDNPRATDYNPLLSELFLCGGDDELVESAMEHDEWWEVMSIMFMLDMGSRYVVEAWWDSVCEWLCARLTEYDYTFLARDDDDELIMEPEQSTRDQIQWVLQHNCGWNAYYAWLSTWNNDIEQLVTQGCAVVQRHYPDEWKAQGYHDYVAEGLA